ncbi:hypothetical protein LCGC14_1571470, partial [marine sediment metagenome]
ASCCEDSTPSKRRPGVLQVLSYKIDELHCSCAYPTDVRYGDKACRHNVCGSSIYTKVRVRNGVVDQNGDIHVECIYYDMAYTGHQLTRQSEHFPPSKTTHTDHEFTVRLFPWVTRSLKKGTKIGVDCRVLASPSVLVVGTIPAKVIVKP